MAAMEWDEPGMKRNKNVRFRMGQGSNAVSYYPPQSALEVGRSPSGYNPNQLPAIRQGGVPAVTSRGALPSVIQPQTGFQMGAGRPVEVSSVARPTTPQLRIGYDPLEQITSEEVQRNLGKNKLRTPVPVSEGAIQRVLPKAAPILKAGVSGAGGAILTDMLFPDKANEFDDVAAINAYGRNKTQGLFAPSHGQTFSHGQPTALGDYQSDLAKFKESQMMQESDYGKVPGSAIIKDASTGRMLAQGSGPSAGGFSRPSTADANLAFEDEQNRLVAEQTKQDQLRREYNDELQGQRNFDGNINWALNNPNAPGAAAFLAQLQQGRKIGQQVTPLSDRQSNLYKAQSEGFSKEATGQNQLAEARTRQAALPYIGPKAEAETGLQNAQARYYSGRNTVELGSARAKALADVLAAKQKQSGKGALDPKNRIDLENMAMTNPEGYARLMKEFGIAG